MQKVVKRKITGTEIAIAQIPIYYTGIEVLITLCDLTIIR